LIYKTLDNWFCRIIEYDQHSLSIENVFFEYSGSQNEADLGQTKITDKKIIYIINENEFLFPFI